MTKSIKLDLAPILATSLILLSGGVIVSPLLYGAWPFVFLAGTIMGVTSNNKPYLTSLVTLALWLFVGYYTFLEYSFKFPMTGYEEYYIQPLVNFFGAVLGEDKAFDIVAWIFILLTNWLGVLLGQKVQKKWVKSGD